MRGTTTRSRLAAATLMGLLGSGAAADRFADLGINTISVTPLPEGVVQVDVAIEIAPESSVPADPVHVEIRRGADVVGAFEIVVPGQMSGSCCFNDGDCESIPGYSAGCHGTCDDGVRHLCHYRRVCSTVVPGVPGDALVATINPHGAHPESLDDDLSNNSMAVTVGDPVGVGAVTDLSIDAVRVVPGAGDAADVFVEVGVTPGLVPIAGEVEITAVTSSGALVSGVVVLPGSPYLCCDGDCPLPPGGTADCLGTCQDASQSGERVCVERRSMVLAGLAVVAGDLVTVSMHAPGIAETDVAAASNNIVVVAVPVCPCDLTGDGVALVDDLLAFLSMWFVGDPGAEFDGIAGVTVEDLLAYLGCWFASCE